MTPQVARESPEAQWQAHSPRVRRFLQRIVRNPSDVEDCVSETSLAFLIACKKHNPPRNPRSWVLQVAWNKVQDHLRQRARQAKVPLSPAIEDGLAAPEIDSEKLADLREWLNTAIDTLPEAQRALLHLRYEEGLNYRSLAKVLSLPLGTVGRRLHNARKDLEASLRRVGRTQKLPCLGALLPLLSREPVSALSLSSGIAAPTIAYTSALWSGLIAMKKFSAVALATIIALVSTYFAYQALEDRTPESDLITTEGMAAPKRLDPVSGIKEAPSTPREARVETIEFSEPVSPNAIMGRVADDQGHPVSNATVVMIPHQHNKITQVRFTEQGQHSVNRKVKTTTDGKFRFELEPAEASNQFDLHALAAGFAPTAKSFVSTASKDLQLTLKPGFEIPGQVVNASGQALAHVEITYHAIFEGGHLQWTTTSDISGGFRVTGVLSRGSVLGQLEHLSLSKDGYASRRYTLSASLRLKAGEVPKKPLVITMNEGFRLSGVVRDEVTKRPVADAQVVVYGYQDGHGNQSHGSRSFSLPFGSRIIARTASNAEGQYQFKNLPIRAEGQPAHNLVVRPEALTGGVVAWSKGYSPDGAGIPVLAHNPKDCVRNLSLRPAASVRGRVVDSMGKGVAGIRVAVRPVSSTEDPAPLLNLQAQVQPVWEVPGEDAPFGGAVTTDEHGNYEIESVRVESKAETLVSVTGCGCRVSLGKTTTAKVKLTPGSSAEVKNLIIHVAPYGGKVVDPQGRPVVGALIIPATGNPMRSGPDGQFSGSYSLSQPHSEQHSAQMGTKVIAEGFAMAQPYLVAGVTDTLIELTPGRALHGTVTDSDGKLLRDVNVTAKAHAKGDFPPLFARSDEAGQFEFKGLPIAPVLVSAHQAGAAESHELEVSAKATSVAIVLLSESQMGTGRLRLLDAITGEAFPIAASSLAYTQSDKSVVPTHSEHNVFSFGPLRPQDLKVHIWVAGFPQMEATLCIKQGETSVQDFKIDTRPSLTGKCQRADGSPGALPSNIRMTATSIDRPELPTPITCAANGTFVFRGLKPGSYAITAVEATPGVAAPLASTAPISVEVGAQPAPELICELSPGHAVRWSLLFPKDAPRLNQPSNIIAIRDLEGRWLLRRRRDDTRPMRSVMELQAVLPKGPLRIDVLDGTESLWSSNNLFPKRSKTIRLHVTGG